MRKPQRRKKTSADMELEVEVTQADIDEAKRQGRAEVMIERAMERALRKREQH
jgi:hypothetical protein